MKWTKRGPKWKAVDVCMGLIEGERTPAFEVAAKEEGLLRSSSN
ncbi:hypothetical protein X737_39525 [Mesorhizobium sp. L48C026A00]|nr:hypothetical protein X737_39525 [Mesorhizobium sp. L48C026A00]